MSGVRLGLLLTCSHSDIDYVQAPTAYIGTVVEGYSLKQGRLAKCA